MVMRLPDEPMAMRRPRRAKGLGIRVSLASLAITLLAGVQAPRTSFAQPAPPTPPPTPSPTPPPTASPPPASSAPTLLPAPTAADAETSPYEGRLVAGIRFVGLGRVSDQYARNQLRTQVGRPLEWALVREDLRRLERLGEFRDIQADILIDADQNVIVQFLVEEAKLITDVVVTGNRQVPDEDVRATVAGVISLMAGVPIDEFQIGRAQRAIEEMYRGKGFYQAQVSIDEEELARNGVIVFRVREGERLKITAIRFSGNHAIPTRELRGAVTSEVAGVVDMHHVHVWSITSGKPSATLEVQIEAGADPAR
ncbi:MAG: hypothetical protein CVV40_00625, partial [Planctomycetes bacterium HGW-Planctomycetes-2]